MNTHTHTPDTERLGWETTISLGWDGEESDSSQCCFVFKLGGGGGGDRPVGTYTIEQNDHNVITLQFDVRNCVSVNKRREKPHMSMFRPCLFDSQADWFLRPTHPPQALFRALTNTPPNNSLRSTRNPTSTPQRSNAYRNGMVLSPFEKHPNKSS